ncbi:MAG: hypothetical protein ACFFDT_28315 [Candidatus Hodarchaeota archaeon]
MKTSFNYQKPAISDVLAPYLKITISDPFEGNKIEVNALLDTGFDGEILIPIKIYEDLNLQAFEFSQDILSFAETASGERLELLSASGAITLSGINVTIIVIIDSHSHCQEVLIGRKFLESYNTSMKGQDAIVELEFLER